MHIMLTWFTQHTELLWWLAAFSAATFVLSILGIPWLVIRIPADYFTSDNHRQTPMNTLRSGMFLVMRIVRNILGIFLLCAGFLMLFLPGQGLLSMAIALMFLDFPGKYRAERWMITRPTVLRAINWIRRKAGVPPLLL